MKSTFKNAMTAVIAACTVSHSAAFADANRISLGDISITGGGLELIGTVSTLSLDDKHPAFTYVGWGLIVAGILIEGGDIAKAADRKELPAVDVWTAMVSEAKVYARNPDLIKPDAAIANASNSLGISAKNLAELTLDMNEMASIAKDHKLETATADIEAKYFPSGFENEKQQRAFKNLVALSTMG